MQLSYKVLFLVTGEGMSALETTYVWEINPFRLKISLKTKRKRSDERANTLISLQHKRLLS